MLIGQENYENHYCYSVRVYLVTIPTIYIHAASLYTVVQLESTEK